MMKFAQLENKAHRKALKVPTNENHGIRVRGVSSLSNAFHQIQSDDVLLEINGKEIGVDGTICLRNQERIKFNYGYIFNQIGDMVNLTFSRDGIIQTKSIKLQFESFNLKTEYCKDHWNNYYLFGGFVFGVLNYEALHESSVTRFRDSYNHANKTGEEVVVLDILRHEVNHGFHSIETRKIVSINGMKPNDLK